MFGASGFAMPMGGSPFSSFAPNYSSQDKCNNPSTSANIFTVFATGSKPHYNTPPQQEFVVDVSLDLMQYMSESFDDMLVPSSAACQQPQQPHKGQAPSTGLETCHSLMCSSCSTHSNQVVPDSPTCTQSQQQQQGTPASSSSDCSMRSSCEADAPAGSSSSPSSSSAGMDLERTDSLLQTRSSSLSYDDEFVFQCYYGDPSSPANQQQQRVKKLSPFAAFATFPGFSC